MCWQISYELIPPLCPLAAIMCHPLRKRSSDLRVQAKKWDCTYVALPDLQMCTQWWHPEVLLHISNEAH